MTRFRDFLPSRFLLTSLALIAVLSSCAAPSPVARRPREFAFITYQPPMEGDTRLRLAVKDMIDMRGQVTSAGSEYVSKTALPAPRDAACLRIARERKVQIVGKTNLGELGLCVSGMNDYFGSPRSPLNADRRLIPGGSSSGSAVAVGTDMADVAFGTDTAGSVRVPAACCGVYGLKTTYGLVPLDGVFPISPRHLDTVGPLAKNVRNLVEGMGLLQRGFEGRYRAAMAAKPTARSVRVGRLYLTGTDPAVDAAIDRALAESGFTVVRLSDDFRTAWEQAQRDGGIVATSDGYLNDRKYENVSGVSALTKATILLGQVNHATAYEPAVRRKAQWQRVLRNTLRNVDLIALPTLQGPPPNIPLFGRTALFESRIFAMQNTVAVNYAGNPALNVPVPMDSSHAPVTGLQFIGPPYAEAQLINAARFIEQWTDDQVVKAGRMKTKRWWNSELFASDD